MNKNDVQVNVPFYFVRALGEGSFMSKIIPISMPYDAKLFSDTETFFIQCDEEINGEVIVKDASMSLRDMGIIPGEYNQHQSFLSEKAAKQHMKLVKKFPNPLGKP